MSAASRFSPFAYSLVAVLALAHCDSSKPPSTPDAGTGPAACVTNEECGSGFLCEGGLCVENACTSSSDCSDGWECDLLSGVCVREEGETPDGGSETPDGGSGNPDGGGSETGGPCVDKYDCPAGDVCRSGRCQAASETGACNADLDCPRGELCNFARQCEEGCVEARDCASPELCHPTKFICESCSLTNPCPAGKSCIAGACTPAVACTGAQDCVNGGMDGAVCIGGFCANCGGHGDCAVEPYKSQERICALDGLCKAVDCTDDNCRSQLGSRGYCDTAANECRTRECLSNADCTQADTVCNLNTYTCVNTNTSCSGSALTQCDSTCSAQGSYCNTATCACAGSSGSGGDGEPCIDASDCIAGYACGLGICTEEAVDPIFGGACDPMLCAFTGCVGAVTGRQCDSFGCLMTLFLGGDVTCL